LVAQQFPGDYEAIFKLLDILFKEVVLNEVQSMALKELTHPGRLKKLDRSVESSFKALLILPYSYNGERD
jgi:hypothetical protein